MEGPFIQELQQLLSKFIEGAPISIDDVSVLDLSHNAMAITDVADKVS